MSRIDTVFFIHVPKTAGTSFAHALEETFAAEQIAWDYGASSPRTTAWVRRHVYEAPDRSRFLDQLISRKIVVFGGHVGRPHYGDVFTSQRTIAFVRDPVERLVSAWLHRRRMRASRRRRIRGISYRIDASWQLLLRRAPRVAEAFEYQRTVRSWSSLEAFAAGSACNLQSRMVGDVPLADYGVLGLTSHYRKALELVRLRFGWTLPYLTQNVNPDKPFESRYRVPHDVAERLRKTNAEDVGLLERAEALFFRSIAALDKGPA